jgi:S1-C subfamily serine protease
MRRTPLYRPAGRERARAAPLPGLAPGDRSGPEPSRPAAAAAATFAAVAVDATPRGPRPGLRARWQALRARVGTGGLALVLALAALVVSLHAATRPVPAMPGPDAFRDAVEHSLESIVIPSQAARAQAIVAPSVVLVEADSIDAAAGSSGAPTPNPKQRKDARPTIPDAVPTRGIGSGVVIVDKGIILTNLHVVEGATGIRVTFADGTRSQARVIGTQPENDLAVLQALTVPDDLVAASLRSSADLRAGDLVVAVGFPFGIGPSTSAGVVSGLKREYAGADGQRVIGNLIQFDAAANPGNSGGPLVNAEGEVVGIVTGILSPGTQRTFIGIGFAVPIEGAASAVGVPPF